MYKRILTAGLVFGMIATGPPAHAMACADRSVVTDNLAKTHHETLTATGLQSADALVEVWSSKVTGSFTILITRPNGISCVVSAGQNWTDVVPIKDPDGVAG